MNKTITIIICILVVLGAMFTAVMIFNPKTNTNENPQNEITKVSDEEIFDECTDEYEELQTANLVQTNSEKEMISPNCSITFKTNYKDCGHTVIEYNNIPENLVNKTEEELKQIYTGWEIEKFASNEVILYKQVEGECGEHYLVKEKDGKVAIYKIVENSEELVEETEISIEYLTLTDKTNIEEGIRVNGKQELNQLIENFE